MTTTIQLTITADSDAELAKAEAALKQAVEKFGAKGMIKMMDKYQTSVSVKLAVNKLIK